MSVREYIGARYVPVFATPLEWDSTQTYEPLTVVSYQGNSYTSRQSVPTGIDITNESYWAQTGNYNAQIEAYRSEVLALQSSYDTMSDDIQALDARLTKDEDTNTKFVVIGDSLSVSDYVGTTNFWPELVKNKLNMDFENFSNNGAGYYAPVSGAPTIAQEIATCLSQIPSSERYKYKYIIVATGSNDFYNTSNFSNVVSAASSALDSLISAFPNSEIIFIPNIFNWRVEMTGSYFVLTKLLVEMGLEKGVRTCAVGNKFFANNDVMHYSDTNTQHPTIEGNARLANCIYDFINGGSGIPTEIIEINNNNASDNRTVCYGHALFTPVGNLEMSFVCILFTQTLTPGQVIKVGELSKPIPATWASHLTSGMDVSNYDLPVTFKSKNIRFFLRNGKEIFAINNNPDNDIILSGDAGVTFISSGLVTYKLA